MDEPQLRAHSGQHKQQCVGPRVTCACCNLATGFKSTSPSQAHMLAALSQPVSIRTYLKVREHRQHLFCNHSRLAVVPGDLGDRSEMSLTQSPSPALPPSPSLPPLSKQVACFTSKITHWLFGLLKGVLYCSNLACTVLHIHIRHVQP